MPSPFGVWPKTEDEILNLRLWTGVLLPPLAAGVNVVVGYIVSNYDCNVHNRRLVFTVNIICLLLCVISSLLVLNIRERIESECDDPSESLRVTRLFLRRLALWFSAGFALLVIAGLISTLTLGACDL